MGRFIFGVVAAFNILAAIVFIGCGACANISDTQTWNIEVNRKRFDEKDLQAHLKKEVPGYPVVKIVGIVLGYCASVGLILSGIALFFGRWWGKLVTAPILGLAFLHHVAMMVYYFVWINPAIEGFFKSIPRPGIFDGVADALIKTQGFAALWPGYVSIAWWIVGCLYYLIATPVVLFTPTSSAAAEPVAKSKRRDVDEDEDEDDDEDDDRQRRRRR